MTERRLTTLFFREFMKKSGECRYKYLVLNMGELYSVQSHTECRENTQRKNIVNIVYFLINNIFVKFGGDIFQKDYISIYQCEQTVHPYWPTCFCFHTRPLLWMDLIQQGDKYPPVPLNSRKIAPCHGQGVCVFQ